MFLRLVNDEDETDRDSEESESSIEEDCDEIFDKDLIEVGYDFYLSQYEGLMRKLFLHAYRKSIFFVLICFIGFFIHFFIKQNEDKDEIIFNIDDWSHLNQQNVFIGIIQNENNQQLFDQMKNYTDQHFPFTHLEKLNSIRTIEEFDRFFWREFQFHLR